MMSVPQTNPLKTWILGISEKVMVFLHITMPVKMWQYSPV